tara:strand:+ start:732 stop:1985 length:1254 start_codon:yes stop_codon:yes gene_type:complete
MVVKLIGMFAGFGVSVFLGRTLGPDGLGIINLANQIISILLVFAFLGFSKVIVKEIAIAHNDNKQDRIKDVVFTAYLINGAVSLLITLALILFADIIANNFFAMPRLKYPLIISSIVFLPQIISRILSSALVGYKKIWQSNLVDQTLSMGVIGTLLFVMWLIKIEINVFNVAVVYAIGRLSVTLCIVLYWNFLNKDKEYEKTAKPKFIKTEMLTRGLPLLIVSASLLISSSADTLMLGWLSSSKEVGLYNIAAKLALLTSFFLQITVSTLGPKIAVLYEKNELKELGTLLQKVTGGLTFIGLGFLLIFVLFGKFILSFWGEDFITAYPILVVLAIGQFFNISSGPVGNILVMTNNEKVIRNITAITVVLNLILNYFLIKVYGGFGAAVATTITTILNMILCYWYVRKSVGIKIIKYL